MGTVYHPSRICPVCGDAIKETTEDCDDTTSLVGDGCESCVGSTCTALNIYGATTCCGNNINDTLLYEACDDQNLNIGDGCSDKCQIEAGFYCLPGFPSVCHLHLCGDGKVTGTEVCDDGSDNNIGCASSCTGNAPGWACSGGSLIQASICSSTVCGDSKVEGTEICDDGLVYCLLDCTGS